MGEKIFKANAPLSGPLTKPMLEAFDRVDVIITVSLGDLINCPGIDGLNEIMDEKTLEPEVNGCLADIRYTVCGSTPGDPDNGVDGDIHIRVQAEIERF
jgi:hypothetical protein